jgi:hypothetical protein
MGRKIRKTCHLCNHPHRDSLEQDILNGVIGVNELDREEDWVSGATRRHMRDHLGDYLDNSNESCGLCTATNRKDLETSIVEGSMKPSEVAEYVGVSLDSVKIHMNKHLKPLVQKAASMELVSVEIDEINMLSNNIQMLQGKVQEFIIDNDDLDHRTIDSLVKLSKEIRESLKYALEFKGQLVHKREETVVIQQIEIIQKVLIERYPQVWNEIRDSVAERLA